MHAKKGKKIHTSSKRKSPSETNSFPHIISSIAFGTLIGIGSAFILTVIGALICYSSEDPDALLSKLAFGILYLSSLIAGFSATLKNRSSALVCGGIAGVAMALLFSFLSLFLKGNADASLKFPLSLLIRLSTIAVSTVGGYIALAAIGDRRRKKKR